MGSTARAALCAGALVALADGWALRRAWGSVGERVAIAVSVGALVVGAALALAPWAALLVDGRRGRSLAAALAGGVALGVPLAMTATARRALGVPLAAIVLPIVAATLLALVARAPRWLAAATGVVALAAELALPLRLYASLRAALVVTAFAALFCALRRAQASRRRSALAVVAPLALVAGGYVLAGLDANTRFVTHAQAPVAALVLDALSLLHPTTSTPALAANSADGDASPLSARAHFAHAGSLADAHLVLVTVDALRADRLERMPALTALAARGVRFTHAYAAAPSTAASITALLTARPPGRLDDRPPTLAEALRAAGWNTADFYPAGLFFDGGGALAPYAASHFGVAWADTRTLPADALTDAALERVRLAAARGEPRSFFWLHYFDPHEPYERHELPASAPPAARYDAEVRAVDRALARLVDGLGAFARPTLLVVTADHGEEFGEHGGAYHGSSLYDEQLRVPLVVALLGGELAPEVIDAPVSLLDLAPTLAALLEAERFGSGATLGDGDVHAAVDTHRMLLRGGFKLIRDTRRDIDELYDLDADPREQHNLADTRHDLAATLGAALDAWLRQPSVAALAAAVVDRTRPAAARADAAQKLGAREAYGGGAALRAALDDDDAAVRAEAALALGQLTDRHARAPLQALLADARFADRAAVMLGRLRDPAAAARLCAMCRRPPADGDRAEAALRRDAAHYLGFVGDAAAVDALFTAAADPRVRGSAYVAVGRIAARLHDDAAAARLRARLAVEDRADARADLLAALALCARR